MDTVLSRDLFASHTSPSKPPHLICGAGCQFGAQTTVGIFSAGRWLKMLWIDT
jgi:hypothetical protein